MMYELSNSSIEEYKCKELRINIAEKLEPTSECCIYKVPNILRNVNEKAYTPHSISIGPFHHGKKELMAMEKHKVRYKKEFGNRITDVANKWETFITFLKNNEQAIRNCYVETITLSSFEFITMILYDAVFIMELLLRYHEVSNDFLVHKPRIRINIWLDLQLLENQIPYFVLEELYKLVKPNRDDNHPNLFSLSCNFFFYNLSHLSLDRTEVKHFVDLIRCALVKSYPKVQLKSTVTHLPCAVKLQESGVKFASIKGTGLLDVRFKKRDRQIPFLKVDELQIPFIQICDETESLFRNVMALEQCHYPFETHVCNYIELMDFLIDTEKDVELLVQKGIIYNYVGDNDVVAKMFNRLCLQIAVSDSCFYFIAQDLEAHYKNSWNHTKAILKRAYFSNLWIGTGTIAAVMLLLFTLIQTICSILQV